MRDIFEKIRENKGPLGQYSNVGHGYFFFPKLEGPISNKMQFRGKDVLVWSLNNYLGLANHPEIREVDAKAAKDWGNAYPMGARMMSGNSNYHDTIRRELHLKNHGIYFLGVGVSGGEEGALIGPSIMPGGSHDAWIHLKEMFQKISAKVDGVPCCDWLGENGSGHFVKMVHNGIEYGDIAIINEAYNILKNYLKLDNSRISEIFSDWNKSELDSYLIEITSDILKYKEKNGAFLVDNILDVAGQKGTGKWTVSSSLEHGVPLTLVSEAVFSRFLSSQKEERVKASKLFLEEKNSYVGDVTEFIDIVKRGVYLSKILSYTQGYALMRKASKFHNWNLDFGKIALLWRGGCIIRSVFLNKIHEAFERNPNLENLLFDSYFISEVKNNIYNLLCYSYNQYVMTIIRMRIYSRLNTYYSQLNLTGQKKINNSTSWKLNVRRILCSTLLPISFASLTPLLSQSQLTTTLGF